MIENIFYQDNFLDQNIFLIMIKKSCLINNFLIMIKKNSIKIILLITKYLYQDQKHINSEPETVSKKLI